MPHQSQPLKIIFVNNISYGVGWLWSVKNYLMGFKHGDNLITNLF
jgi:hypothetical protein